MKTLKQIKEEVAKEYGFDSYLEMIDYEDGFDISIINEIANRHAKEQLLLHGVSKSLNADELINSLGTPDVDNEYIIKPDKHGKWQIEHKHVGSGEPLKQWLTGKP